MKKTFTIALISFLFFMTETTAQGYTIEKWDVTDITINARIRTDKPFHIDFGAVFTHESGKTMNIPGFYNGGNNWVIRFCPPSEGRWNYETYSELRQLNGRKGTITVNPNTNANRHGAVKIDENNSQRFVYEDGTPYYSLAFEIDWLFALDAENPHDIPRTRQIVGHMAENGFNKAIMNVYAYDAGWGEREKIDPRFNFAKPNVFPFGGTNEDPDHSTLNVEFFQRFDRVMSELNDQGIVSHLMIYVWNKFVNWAQPGSPEDNLYFDYVVKRYQAYPNLLWDISKEALAYGMDDMDYITSRFERLRRLDGHKRLATVHEYTYCKAHPDKVDFISIQEWRHNLYNEMLEVAERHPNMPIYNVEHGGYEKTMHSIFNGAYTDPLVCLERSYICVFAGTYTTYYWQNASWYELVYDPFSLATENQPNFHWYKVLADFMKDYEFNSLVPDQYFYSPYCLTNNDDLFIYYIPMGMFALEGMAPKQAQGKRVEIQWLNPLNGKIEGTETRTLGGWTGFRKPTSVSSPMALAIMKVLD
jgi:hypothetical protein